jgi:hypothetical protein
VIAVLASTNATPVAGWRFLLVRFGLLGPLPVSKF